MRLSWSTANTDDRDTKRLDARMLHERARENMIVPDLGTLSDERMLVTKQEPSTEPGRRIADCAQTGFGHERRGLERDKTPRKMIRPTAGFPRVTDLVAATRGRAIRVQS